MSSFALQAGALFAERYSVGRCLKIGGMGAVYEVTDTRTNAPRALKVMNPDLVEDPELRARFEQEARIVGQVESDHLVRTFDAGVDPATGTPFLVMELLRGEELGALLKRRGGLPAEEVAIYLLQAARAIDKTHAAGIVHRDLKPENLFVTVREDGTACVKVLDFGIAKFVDKAGQSRLTRAAGTPMFMAPEQIQGKSSVGFSVDLYALGQIAYTLLVGEPYWREEAKALEMFPLFTTILSGPQERPRDRAQRRKSVALPPAFDEWFLKATAAQPEMRFRSAAELVATLSQKLGLSAPASPRDSLTGVPSAPGPVLEPARSPEFDSGASHRSAPVSGATAQPVTSPSELPIAPPPKSSQSVLVIAAATTAAVIVVPAVLLMIRSSSTDSPAPASAAVAAAAATSTSGKPPEAVQVAAPTETATAAAPVASSQPSAPAASSSSSQPIPTARPSSSATNPASRPGGKRSIF